MKLIRSAVLAGTAVMTASTALAADPSQAHLPPPPVLKDTTSGWYLRGDVGFANHKRPEADFTAADFNGNLAKESIGDSGVLGAGVGYRFSPYLRADLTLDHRFNTRFRGTGETPDYGFGSLTDKGRFQSSTLMLNGYVDIGTFGGFTPYVGAGIGVARNVLSHYSRSISDGVSDVPSVEGLAGDTDYSFAWALMAGLGYQVTPHATLDIGYRFVNMGGVKSRGYGDGAGAEVESLGAHEVRLGLRYALP